MEMFAHTGITAMESQIIVAFVLLRDLGNIELSSRLGKPVIERQKCVSTWRCRRQKKEMAQEEMVRAGFRAMADFLDTCIMSKTIHL